ncbi:MAG TPA: hypothetical protein VLJ17_19225 [Xanthobacteraceae bacterium]|nr:hypothetical protein [Xanthobacteraceae bacterium]
MADAKPSYQWPDSASQHSNSHSLSDELQLLREETKRLRELVIQLSKIAIKSAIDAK